MCLFYVHNPPLSLSLYIYIYIYTYIYTYCHPQTDSFIVSQLFSVARHTGRFKLSLKPAQLYVRLARTLVGWKFKWWHPICRWWLYDQWEPSTAKLIEEICWPQWGWCWKMYHIWLLPMRVSLSVCELFSHSAEINLLWRLNRVWVSI